MTLSLRSDRLAVAARLLTALKTQPDVAFTRQWTAANMNYNDAKFLIDGLLLNGYVVAYASHSRTRYKITVKGRDFLNQIVDCYMLLDEIECCVDRFVKEVQKELEAVIK